jgi:hypothetical protein
MTTDQNTIRDLNVDEINAVSGGETYTCTVEVKPSATIVDCYDSQGKHAINAIYYKQS